MNQVVSTLSTWPGEQIASLPLSLMLVLFGLALLISAVGFYRVVYFISIGYAFSIAAMAITAVLLLHQNLTWAAALQNLLLVIWGLRLGIFLVRRELKPAYGKELAEVHARSAGMSLARKAIIWVGVSLLYVIMFTPSLFVLSPAPGATAPDGVGSLVQWLGLAIMAGALVMESLADQQKSAFKARSPGQFCNAGLYRWVRCPNYLGEILFWVGNWVAALLFYETGLRWLLALSGLVCIVLIMLGSTKRLEAQQDKRYARDPAYQNYVRTTPILIPFAPIYTLHNLRVYLG
jgi:steroid 5-alpha reductase family enzyme